MTDLIEFAKQICLEPKKTASTHGGEYVCACPSCGGKDRFHIWPERQARNCQGIYWCRQCQISGDAIQFCRDFLGASWEEAISKVRANVIYSKISFEKPISRQIKPPPLKWQEKASSFVDWASRAIESHPEILAFLDRRGIPYEAVKRYRIGYCENKKEKHGSFHIPFSDFGLPDEYKANGEAKSLWIPKGIVIPTIEPSGAIVRIKIRRTDWSQNDRLPKYIALTGSMQGMNLVGDRGHRVMGVVESELDAYALHHSIGDFAFFAAVGSNTKHPDNFTDHLATIKHFLLICHDNDEGGKKMLEKWKVLYPHAQAHPVSKGKDIGEAVQNGVDLRRWFTTVLPEEFQNKLLSAIT